MSVCFLECDCVLRLSNRFKSGPLCWSGTKATPGAVFWSHVCPGISGSRSTCVSDVWPLYAICTAGVLRNSGILRYCLCEISVRDPNARCLPCEGAHCAGKPLGTLDWHTSLYCIGKWYYITFGCGTSALSKTMNNVCLTGNECCRWCHSYEFINCVLRYAPTPRRSYWA